MVMQNKLKIIREELERTPRGNEKYIELVTRVCESHVMLPLLYTKRIYIFRCGSCKSPCCKLTSSFFPH